MATSGPRAWRQIRLLGSARCVQARDGEGVCVLTSLQLSAQLKTRLSYAMVKVQNGWEKQSLEELEEQTSQRGSPISVPSRNDGTRPIFDSPLGNERRRRPSGVSENSDQMLISPERSTPSEPARSLATTPSCRPTPVTYHSKTDWVAAIWRPATKPAMNAAVNLISITGSDAGPMLGLGADIGPRRKRRSSATHHPPPLLGSGPRKHHSDLTPRTPATPRPGILRIPSQQAEKDAVDTLLFMSSPNNSGRLAHTSMDSPAQRLQGSTPRRVMFDMYPGREPDADDRPPVPAHSTASAAYYQAQPSR